MVNTTTMKMRKWRQWLSQIVSSRPFPAELVGKAREVANATHPKLDIGTIHTSGDGGKPAHHNGVKLWLRHFFQERLNHHWRLRLVKKNNKRYKIYLLFVFLIQDPEQIQIQPSSLFSCHILKCELFNYVKKPWLKSNKMRIRIGLLFSNFTSFTLCGIQPWDQQVFTSLFILTDDIFFLYYACILLHILGVANQFFTTLFWEIFAPV